MSKYFTHNGERQSISGWARKFNLPVAALQGRLRRGWTFERAFATPLESHGINSKPRKSRAGKLKADPSGQIVQLLRANTASQRETARMLRQFNCDLMRIMERSIDRGVVENVAKTPSDQLLPSTQDSI